jgi:DNA primase
MAATKIDNRGERVTAAHAMLATAVGQLQSSDGWKQMLLGLARGGRYSLRRFSFRNQLLVAMQAPGATSVATYQAWQRAGRQVRKGEKAITILAPVVVKESKKDKPEETESKLIGFRPHLVFPSEATDACAGPRGRPLPEPVRVTRDVDAPEAFADSVEVLRNVALGLGPGVVVSVDVRPRQPGDHPTAEGWYSRSTRSIVIISGEKSRAQMFATLVHEIAHAILHDDGDHHARAENEIEAESVAFVVSKVLGLDVGCYSFGYVAHWAGQEDAEKAVLASGQRIVRAVNVILDALLGGAEEAHETAKAA